MEIEKRINYVPYLQEPSNISYQLACLLQTFKKFSVILNNEMDNQKKKFQHTQV